jgi:peroxiredoxin
LAQFHCYVSEAPWHSSQNVVYALSMIRRHNVFFAVLMLLSISALLSSSFAETKQKVVWSDQEKPLVEQLRGLRSVADDKRGDVTKDLAFKIRQLPPTANKLRLASGLANLSTEGDFGHDTLQEVATTLAEALRQQPQPDQEGKPASPYVTLAQLVRYEHVQAALDAAPLAEAMTNLEAADRARQQANFTLNDMDGHAWTLKDLRGKVLLVNFWATWCPPCRKEMPDLESLYKQFKDQGLVILAISDEEAIKVKPFIAERHVTYPVLLDLDRQAHKDFQIEGIPKSFVYDREGKLVSQAIDMRTHSQFMKMLEQAGLHE